jgi:hypothetical protein
VLVEPQVLRVGLPNLTQNLTFPSYVVKVMLHGGKPLVTARQMLP